VDEAEDPLADLGQDVGALAQVVEDALGDRLGLAWRLAVFFGQVFGQQTSSGW
jgi:hypothetical protein